MQYDLNVVLNNADGTPADDEGKPATMRTALARALVTDPPGVPMSGDKKIKRYTLFSRVALSDAIDLSVDEVALAKEAADVWPTLIYGQIVAFLDQRI